MYGRVWLHLGYQAFWFPEFFGGTYLGFRLRVGLAGARLQV